MAKATTNKNYKRNMHLKTLTKAIAYMKAY